MENQIFRFLVRVDSWYLWEIHFLNFRDFQESPNPLKVPIPTPAPDHLLGGHNEIRKTEIFKKMIGRKYKDSTRRQNYSQSAYTFSISFLIL